MKEIIYGIHSVTATLEHAPERLIEVFVMPSKGDGRLPALLSELKKSGIAIQSVTRQWLDKKSQKGNHQGILAVVMPQKTYTEQDIPHFLAQTPKPLFLILDGITDPHNLGACLRSADATGVTAIIMPKDRSAPLNSIAQKVACGAADTIPTLLVTNLARTIRTLQENHVWVVGTDGSAQQSLYEVNFKTPHGLALVMGAEGDGMRRLTREHCDELVKIPMVGSVSSLNVSVATGVCLFEILRQKQP